MELTKAVSLSLYQSYLLRLWRPEPGADWRIILESVQNGERECFGDLEALLASLAQQMQALEGGEQG
ncbi:MAG: hypothetical protein JXB35_14015 [Anaerolineae bacterium]|nr:hypothetical protein [Anaerolineae bacterium]